MIMTLMQTATMIMKAGEELRDGQEVDVIEKRLTEWEKATESVEMKARVAHEIYEMIPVIR